MRRMVEASVLALLVVAAWPRRRGSSAKKVGDKTYVHRSGVSELPAELQKQIEQAAHKAGPFAWSVVRVGPEGVMLGRTTPFGRDPHPALIESVLIRPGRDPVRRTYSGDSRPIYHRTELMLASGDPRRKRLARLSSQEEKEGLLGRSDIGTRRAWKKAQAGGV